MIYECKMFVVQATGVADSLGANIIKPFFLVTHKWPDMLCNIEHSFYLKSYLTIRALYSLVEGYGSA
jgi:hypothetical protein